MEESRFLSEARRQYLCNIKRAKKELEEKLDDTTRDRDDLLVKFSGDIEPLNMPFLTEKEFVEVYYGKVANISEKQRKLSEDLSGKSVDLIKSHLFSNSIIYHPDTDSLMYTLDEYRDYYGHSEGFDIFMESGYDIPKIDFSVFNFTTLPFVVTRSIYNLENDLWYLGVEYFNMLEHIKMLQSQLDDYESASAPQVSLPNSHYNSSYYTSNIVDPPEELNNDQIEELGFPKTQIVVNIKRYLHNVGKQVGKKAKIDESRKLFKYLNSDYGKLFIEAQNNFKDTVILKLEEFYHHIGLREASTWFRRIFGRRISTYNEYKMKQLIQKSKC